MVIIAVIQVPPLLHRKQYRELAAFGLVWLVAAVYASLVAAEVPLPSVLEILTFLYEMIPLPFFKTMYSS